MGWATTEVVLAADIALLLTVTIAIGYAIAVLRRLRALRSAQAEWAAQLAEFSARAEAAEAGFARMRATLEAERARRATAPVDAPTTADETPLAADDARAPLELTDALADPVGPPQGRRPRASVERSILSMQ